MPLNTLDSEVVHKYVSKILENNQQRNQIIEQAQLLNVLKKTLCEWMLLLDERSKKTWKNQMMKKQWSLMFMDD